MNRHKSFAPRGGFRHALPLSPTPGASTNRQSASTTDARALPLGVPSKEEVVWVAPAEAECVGCVARVYRAASGLPRVKQWCRSGGSVRCGGDGGEGRERMRIAWVKLWPCTPITNKQAGGVCRC